MKIPGLIVLYNPNLDDVISNIETYIESLDLLYVFDNSDIINHNQEILEKSFAKVKYYSFNENKGIAFALNYILNIIYECEYNWALIMDQDSSFSMPNGVKNYIDLISKEMDNEIVLFCPFYPEEKSNKPQFYTSGSVIELQTWVKIGRFNEELFIDEVDGDYTYRLIKNQCKLKKIIASKINHKLGDKSSRIFLNKIFYSDNHTALRKYYIARNRIYLMKKRPDMRAIYFFDSLMKFISFIIVESDKQHKFRMILKGIYDGLTNNMGKYKKNEE